MKKKQEKASMMKERCIKLLTVAQSCYNCYTAIYVTLVTIYVTLIAHNGTEPINLTPFFMQAN